MKLLDQRNKEKTKMTALEEENAQLKTQMAASDKELKVLSRQKKKGKENLKES